MTKSSSPGSWRDALSLVTLPLDTILGTTGLVRALRVLCLTPEPMPVRELARRARQYIRAIQLAVDRLERAGLVERVGTGGRPHVRLVEHHPLLPALRALFAAERERLDRIERGLRDAVRDVAVQLEAAWIEPLVPAEGASAQRVVVGILGSSASVGQARDTLRQALVPLGRAEDVLVEVIAWTRADLIALAAERQAALTGAWPLLGPPPSALLQAPRARGRGSARTGSRSHAAREIMSAARVRRLASLLRRHPELLHEARAEVADRLAGAPPPEARTWREWRDLLASHRPLGLVEWLAGSSEDAERLRQSLPTTFTRALRQAEAHDKTLPHES